MEVDTDIVWRAREVLSETFQLYCWHMKFLRWTHGAYSEIGESSIHIPSCEWAGEYITGRAFKIPRALTDRWSKEKDGKNKFPFKHGWIHILSIPLYQNFSRPWRRTKYSYLCRLPTPQTPKFLKKVKTPNHWKNKIFIWAIRPYFTGDSDFSIEIEVKNAKIAQISSHCIRL